MKKEMRSKMKTAVLLTAVLGLYHAGSMGLAALIGKETVYAACQTPPTTNPPPTEQ